MDTYLVFLLGALALAAAVWFDPVTRTKIRQMRQHHPQQELDVRFDVLTAAPLPEPHVAEKRKRRKSRRRSGRD